MGGTGKDQDGDSGRLYKAPIQDPILVQVPGVEEQTLVSDVLVTVAWVCCQSMAVQSVHELFVFVPRDDNPQLPRAGVVDIDGWCVVVLGMQGEHRAKSLAAERLGCCQPLNVWRRAKQDVPWERVDWRCLRQADPFAAPPVSYVDVYSVVGKTGTGSGSKRLVPSREC